MGNDAGQTPLLVALLVRIQRRLIRIDPDARRQECRRQRMMDDGDLWADAYQRGGPLIFMYEWARALDDLIVGAIRAHVGALRSNVRRAGHMNIHDPKVQGESGATFRKALQALCCVALMQLCVMATVGAEHTGSMVLEAITVAVLAASIVGCLVTTAREVWYMGRLGKALLDSAR